MKNWDVEEKNWQSKGHHECPYNKVDNKTDLVGFGSGEPQVLKSKPFWIGTANSTRHITALNNLEFSTFLPFATGGGPRWTKTEKYRSGLIAIPPQAD